MTAQSFTATAPPSPADRLPARSQADVSMVSGMRMLLALSALMSRFIDPMEFGIPSSLTWFVLSGYVLHSAVLFVLVQTNQPFSNSRVLYWLDVLWYALIVYCSGGNSSFFFPFFFFGILIASFQFGFDEGAHITLASAVLAAAAAVGADLYIGRQPDVARMLLRTTFLLALGYMIAYWGGLGVIQKRRLALLRDVSRLSNPRFGVEHTLASVLEKTRVFFGADSCILIMRDTQPDSWRLRTASAEHAGRPFGAGILSTAAAAPLLVFDDDQTVTYQRVAVPGLGWLGGSRALRRGQSKWTALADDPGAGLGDLFDTGAFLSAPLPLRKGEGRLYVLAPKAGVTRTDATFLNHIAEQVFPLIETIELLDRLASEAAFRERQKIARDLHDTTIQPYIGLRHGLAALRMNAAADNPLVGELERLIEMSGQVIGDMRQFAKTFQRGLIPGESELVVALRRQAAQVREFYGIDIEIGLDGPFEVSDRLAAEVFQIVNEGMSNIRKHSMARSGRVGLLNADGQLCIRIENDNPDGAPRPFRPGSISERAAALGGSAEVQYTERGATLVSVAIPV